MKRRVICGLLAALLLLSLFPVTASAASNMQMSEKAIALLKQFEGFSPKAYKDNTQYSIGYGTACGANEYPNGITEEKADELLRLFVDAMEIKLNAFADKYNLSFTQNEFDALMLFTYNVGYGWTTTDSNFRQAVISGKTGNDFIFAMTRWCTDGTNVLPGLVTRRLAEADLYLNGYYSTKAPDNFTYVIMDPNGGACDVKIEGYDATTPTKVRANPVYTGYRFLGWYTAKEGGEWITDLDATTKGITLYAHWQEGEGSVGENGEIQGTPANYQRKVTGSALDVYMMDGTGTSETKLADGATVTIVADYIDDEGTKWGRLKEGGWIELTDTYVETEKAPDPVRPSDEPEKEEDKEEKDDLITEEGVLVTVIDNYVNYRTGPSTSYTLLGRLGYGAQVRITEVTGTGTYKWGKFDKGWVCLLYTNYDSVVISGGNQEQMIGFGSVVTSSLRIRSDATTMSETLGTLSAGTYVEIYETKEAEGMTWGRIGEGKWISLKYVSWTTYGSQQPVGPETPAEPEKPAEPETPAEPEKPAEPETPAEPEQPSGVNGTVTASALCIRSGAGTTNKVLGTYQRGASVVILEQKTVNGTPWGKTDKGWICLSYVKLETTENQQPSQPSEPEDSGNQNIGSDNNGNAVTGVVTATGLNIRAAASTGSAVVGRYGKGDTVTILERKMVNGVLWGKTDKGWICMSYVKISSGNVNFSGTVTATALCIRSAAGTGNAIVGSYKQGATVTILETKKVGNTTWGRTDKGWISLDYVK